MNTNKFRTRQEIVRTYKNPKAKKYVIGLDIGYSSVKCFHENGYFCFPSYAKKVDEVLLTGEKDILYKDVATGETYMLGYSAQEMIHSTDTNDTDAEFFSRKRYGSKLFKILCNAAIGLAMQYKNDNRDLVIQTGLPSSYETADTPAIRKAITAPAEFKLKVGEQPWHTYKFTIEPEAINVMPQPAGSLYSALIKDDGTYIPNAKEFLFGNFLVMDIGFGTFDFYGIKSRSISCKESKDEIGMREVLKRTSKKILEELNEDIRLQALQQNLSTGYVTCINEDEMKAEEKPIAKYLEQANDEVFKEAMDNAKNITSAFRDYRNLIVTGGTGEAWFEKIKTYLSGMKNLNIMPANLNDHLPMLYSNSRGYYMYCYMMNKK